MTDMRKRKNRIYAADLMQRAEIYFDARDISVVGGIIELIEKDMSIWLNQNLRGTVSRDYICNKIANGAHRPPVEFVNDEGKSNVK